MIWFKSPNDKTRMPLNTFLYKFSYVCLEKILMKIQFCKDHKFSWKLEHEHLPCGSSVYFCPWNLCHTLHRRACYLDQTLFPREPLWNVSTLHLSVRTVYHKYCRDTWLPCAYSCASIELTSIQNSYHKWYTCGFCPRCEQPNVCRSRICTWMFYHNAHIGTIPA